MDHAGDQLSGDDAMNPVVKNTFMEMIEGDLQRDNRISPGKRTSIRFTASF